MPSLTPNAVTRRRLLLGGGLAMAAPLAVQAMPAAAAAHESRVLMGTRVDLTVVDADPARRAAALAAAWQRMAADAARWTRFDGDSELARLATAAGTHAVGVGRDTAELLRGARRCAEATGGCFDPTVGAYEDWHFGDGAEARVPAAARLAAQRRHVGFEHLEIARDAPRARLARSGMRLDLGGFAKLPVLAGGLQALQQAGVRRAMVNGGGDVLCLGQGEDPAWRIGVRDPAQPSRLCGVVALRSGVVASSGDYERFFIDAQGRRQHHILDPRSGWPTRGLHGVTLVAEQVEAVNGLGAAIMVGGVRRAQSWLAGRAGVDALAVGDDGAWFAGRMAERLAPV